ncbi:efflux transporter outer membrane subunit [Dyella sp. C9]|uniref:efflux transporter outer membrane subunit n=1 Tax=Dyella sp. C9 TaxID=2202154 RepID=UPI000DEFCDDA|nr:efflux transporter outer membrane subunit [Dyella sp. C9]
MAVSLVTLLAACASMAPPHQTPPQPVPNSWPADTQPGAGARAADIAWRDYFTDPKLQQVIATALDNNRDLRVAMLRVQEARAAYRIQRSEQYPTIGLGAQGTRAQVPGDLNISGQPVISSDYEFYVGMTSWELDLWGRVRSLKESALQQYFATEAAQRAVRLALIAQVANSYLALRELDERLALARETIATRQESYRIFSRRHDVGSASKLELTDVQTLLTQAQALGAQLEQERATQAHALAQLVGAPVDLAPDNTRFDDASVFAPLQAGLPSELLADRPDIQASEYRLRAANANIGAARADFFPRIALTASFGTASAQLDGLFASGSRAWTFVPSVTLPVFDTGRRQANLELSEVRRDIAVADYDNTVQNAFREVADALSAKQWLGEQVRIQREAVDAQTERARLAKLRYDNGATPYLEVLDAQRALLSAEQELVRARRALLSSQVSLYAALGGGVSAPDAAPNAATPGP